VRIYLSFRRDHQDERGEPDGPGSPVAATSADRSADPSGPIERASA